MKRHVIFLWLMVISFGFVAQEETVLVAVKAQQFEKVALFLGVVGDATDNQLFEIAQIVKNDFELTEQCTVTLQHFSSVQKKSEIKKLFEQNYYLAVFISSEKNCLSWRLYDTHDARMVVGKKCEKKGSILRGWAHNLADQIWPEFMGSASSFSSKIAYCLQVWQKHQGKDKVYKHIYLSDADGKNVRPLIEIPTICMAPRWSNNPDDPILFYSENTLSNVRLVMANMFGKRRTICSFDGLNMLPAFSDDHKNIVFCLSKDGSSQLYHSFLGLDKKREFHRLTDNKFDNFSPCYINDRTVAFVSDYKTGNPQIYLLDIKTLEISPVTTEGYCACPAYSKVNNKLLYSKMMGRAMQIFTYDLETKTHEQLTTGIESKEEGSWSPCGNFIIFAARSLGKSRIAKYNILTGRMRYITPATEHCTYPAWSPVHTEFIG